MSSQPRRATDPRTTVDEFLRMPEEEGYRLELVRGMVMRESAPGRRHGMLSVVLASLLHQYASARNLGDVLVNTGFVLSRTEHTVRVPDLSFVSAARPVLEAGPDSPLEGAPDLAVEVLSPSNRAGEMREKVHDYIAAGCLLVWVVDPRRRKVTVHRPGEEARRGCDSASERSRPEAARPSQPAPVTSLAVSDVLTGDPVLPGFRMPLSQLFGY